MKHAILFALICALIIPNPGCKKDLAQSGGDTLIYARFADSTKLDAADIEDGESVKVCTNLFETLVTYAKDSGEVVPCLAKDWRFSDDGKTVSFALRGGVRFHDGTLLNANAVVFCFNRLLDEKNPYRFQGAFSYASNYVNIASVKALDKLEVVFTLKEASVVFLANLAMFPASIQSPTAIQKHKENYFKNPVGTGPFRFISWAPKEKIVLEAFAGYWGPKAKVRRLIFKPVPENSARRVQLEKGEIHMMDGINYNDVEGLKKNGDLAVQVEPAMSFGYLAMNTLRPPFDRKEVRQAVAHALDKQKLHKLAFFGLGELGPNPMPSNVFGYNRSIQDRVHDPAKAKSLLAAAGIEPGLEVTLYHMPNARPYMPQPKKVAQVIKESLKEVGINAKLVTSEWSMYLEETKNGKHDMCLLGWSTDNGDPDNFLWQLLGSENARLGSALNVSFYKNPEVDKLFAEAKRTLDKPRRRGLYEKAQELLFEDAPMIPLVYTPQMVAMRKNVTGYRLHPLGLVRLWNAEIGK